MSPIGRTVGEFTPGNALPDGLQTTSSQAKIVSPCDKNSPQADDLPTVARQSVVNHCDTSVLAKNKSSANRQTRGNARVDVTLNSVYMRADDYALVKYSKSNSSQDIVLQVAASKMLHEKQYTFAEGVLCIEAVAESAACLSPVRSTMVSSCDDDAAASPPSARLFSDSENQSPRPARIRRGQFSRSFDSVPAPRAPMKPNRVKSLNTLFPGKTRRRLDFDHL